MRKCIFKYRGLLLLPSAIILLILGRPNIQSLFWGTLIVLAGEAIRIWGVGYAGETTRSDKVEAPFLVTAGPYAYIRNPLYGGNFLIGFGFCIISTGELPYYINLLMIMFFFFSYLLVYGSIIPLEEKFLEETFGEVYKKYYSYVPGLIPFKKPYSDQIGMFTWKPVKKGEIHTLLYLTIAWLIFAGRAFHLWNF